MNINRLNIDILSFYLLYFDSVFATAATGCMSQMLSKYKGIYMERWQSGIEYDSVLWTKKGV